MSEKTVVAGKRTITYHPTAPIDQRRQGRIAADGYRERTWYGGTVGEVCDQMNHDLGPVPSDDDYEVTE